MRIKRHYFSAGVAAVVVGAICLTAFVVVIYMFWTSYAWERVAKGYECYENGEYEEAIQWYDQALKLRPRGRGHILYSKARALAALGRFEEAVELYEEALPHYAGDDYIYAVYREKADALSELSRWEEAVASYGQAIQYNPDPIKDAALEGAIRFAGENYAEAIAYFEAAAKTNPDNYELYQRSGLSWLALGRYEKAISDFDEVIELAPDYAPAWERKALALGLMGRYDAALACADRALALDADAPDAWNTKGKILLYSGDAGGARECFGRALAPHPSSPEALVATGMTYFAEGDYAEARPYFEELVVGENESTYYLLYLYLIDRAEGLPGTDRLQPLLDAPHPWVKTLCHFLLGRINADDLVAAAEGDRVSLCEAHFFIGYKNKLDGDDDAARRHFREAVAAGRHEQAEYSLARYELAAPTITASSPRTAPTRYNYRNLTPRRGRGSENKRQGP